MINRRSLGTSHGMRRWIAKIPSCKKCRKKKLIQHSLRDFGYCISCAREILTEGVTVKFARYFADSDRKHLGKIGVVREWPGDKDLPIINNHHQICVDTEPEKVISWYIWQVKLV